MGRAGWDVRVLRARGAPVCGIVSLGCALTSFGRCFQQSASSLLNSSIDSLFSDFSLTSKAFPGGCAASVPEPFVCCFSSTDSGDGLQLRREQPLKQ